MSGEQKREALRVRKTGKKERIKELLDSLRAKQPKQKSDFRK